MTLNLPAGSYESKMPPQQSLSVGLSLRQRLMRLHQEMLGVASDGTPPGHLVSCLLF